MACSSGRFVMCVPVDDDEDKEPKRKSEKKVEELVAFATFNKDGSSVWAGTTKGRVLVFDTSSKQIVRKHQLPTKMAVKSLAFSKKGDFLVINSHDRVLRCYDSASMDLKREFSDVVNKVQWKKSVFSANDEYVVAVSQEQSAHSIYIWNRAFGQLIKILQGPKEGTYDICHHPILPVIASLTAFGCLYIWAKSYMENWSAFAPNFEELEDNTEYEEREDEFDLVAQKFDDRVTEEAKAVDDVDIITTEKLFDDFSDCSDSEGPELTHLQVVPLVDPEVVLLHQQNTAHLEEERARLKTEREEREKEMREKKRQKVE